MANTSPAACQCLATMTPLHFSWCNFSARSSFYIFNWYGYPRGSHENYLKEIVGLVFEMYAIELLGSMSTDEAWRHLRTLHFDPEYIDLPGVCIQKFLMIHWILQ